MASQVLKSLSSILTPTSRPLPPPLRFALSLWKAEGFIQDLCSQGLFGFWDPVPWGIPPLCKAVQLCGPPSGKKTPWSSSDLAQQAVVTATPRVRGSPTFRSAASITLSRFLVPKLSTRLHFPSSDKEQSSNVPFEQRIPPGPLYIPSTALVPWPITALGHPRSFLKQRLSFSFATRKSASRCQNDFFLDSLKGINGLFVFKLETK